jgi:lysozyme
MWSRSGVRCEGTAALALLGVVAVSMWVLLPHFRPGLRPGERYGIDVSTHQGQIDWSAVAGDRISFAYIKASEGGDFVDERFTENWDGASAAGLDRGAYHFFTLCRSGAEQAGHFLSVAIPDPAALAPAVDLELKGNCARRPTREEFLVELRVFLDRVERAWDRQVVIYTTDDFDDVYPVRGLSRLLWEAPYYRRPPANADWVIWQVTSLASVKGVEGRVDLDITRGTGSQATP